MFSHIYFPAVNQLSVGDDCLYVKEQRPQFPAKGLEGVHPCKAAIALYHGDSWGLYFQLYYLNCLGKYVQQLYYQFMASLATPLIQPLKYCNQWLKRSAGGA